MLSSLALIDCNYYGNVEVIYTIKNILSFIRIFIPIILIVMCMIDVLKTVLSDLSKENKLVQKLTKKLLAAAIIFLLPSIIDVIMQISNGINLTTDTCWTEATKENIEILKAKAIEEAETNTQNAKNNLNDQNEAQKSKSELNYTEREKTNTNKDNSTNNTKKTAEVYIFVGDSRTVGMDTAVGKKDKVKIIAKIGEGYNWFKNTAISAVNKELKSVSGSAYIFTNMGVNDLAVDNYISEYKSLATSDWKKHKIVVVSVGPVDEAMEKKHGYSVKNSQIESFNSKLKKGISSMSNISYCDTYNNVSGYKTTDGVHYTNDTYKKIYNYIMDNCRT